MENLHNRNAEILNEIIDTIGYPTIDKIGKEASEAVWLVVIQHSIGQPDFIKKCLKLLENVISENKTNPRKATSGETRLVLGNLEHSFSIQDSFLKLQVKLILNP